ncbi:pentapeptide repeat-containing protein [Sulfurimonas aquatica]|uniref:Pentapeptide repeat-containing protein n=1 Tax=Sulfurimonas aquatica TaxID=2672570 RepID=A0A975AYX6_9BACT|nr:pentapeptide repeat-containing protein [Sulfurimonas aquatica]QSZ41058.1 pentapeptide repeat-containing protein [Sulfurimonas aquatica]
MSKSAVVIVDGLDCFAEDFEKIEISGESVKSAEFEECSFISCDFSETLWRSCRFIDCHFKNCNMSVMRLTDSKLSGCTFESSKMLGIDWTMCDWKSLLTNDLMKFYKCILNDSNFYGISMDGVEMKECSAKELDLRLGSFKNADFSGSDFKGSLFENTHLEYANFSDASNTHIDLKNNYLQGTRFSRYEALYLLESMGIVLVD